MLKLFSIRDNIEFQDWVKEYSGKCLASLSKRVLNLMMYSVTKNSNAVCKSSKRSREFLRLGSCGNAAKSDTIKCWANLTKAMDGISHHENNKMKIPLICW